MNIEGNITKNTSDAKPYVHMDDKKTAVIFFK